MIFGYICLVLTIAIAIWALRLKRNLKDEIEGLNKNNNNLIYTLSQFQNGRDAQFQKLTDWEEQLNKRQTYCDEYADKLSAETAVLRRQQDQIEDLTFNGWKYLGIMEERYGGDILPPETTQRSVSVVVRHPESNPKTFIIIKNFWYDKYNDDDYKAARRKAEELLKTIKNG